MAELLPPKAVKEPYSLNKKGKYMFAAVSGCVLVGLLAIYWLKDRSKKEDVSTNVQTQAQDADLATGGPQKVTGQDIKTGVDATTAGQNVEQEFTETVSDYNKKKETEDRQAKMETERKHAEEVETARREAQKGKNGAPGSVGQDGTATNGKVLTPEEAEQARKQANAGINIPPEAPVDPTMWVKTEWGRVRPTYQTKGRRPYSQEYHNKLEEQYWKGFYAPAVVGLSESSNAEITRTVQDHAAVRGGFGVKQRTPQLRVGAKLPPPPVEGGGGWGGWITVKPAGDGAGGKK